MTVTESLLISSCMAPIADEFVRALAEYAAQRLGIVTRVVDDIPWQQREQWLDEGRAQLGWLCGLPYVWKADGEPQTSLQLLAAPVMQAPRYRARPVYFSDVVVRLSSLFAAFPDLRGTRWAYNEQRSHSGHLITRYNLARHGLNGDFFGDVVGAGSHQQALTLLLADEIDATAIDSTVLELAVQAQPEIGAQIRVLESWGPSPAPPWLVHRSLAPALRQQLQRLFLTMHKDEEGRAVLQRAGMAHFARVDDEDYDPIRHMARRAAHVTLGERV